MEERKLMKLGGAGALMGTIVCLTPIGVGMLASIGLASWFGVVDGVFHVAMLAGVAALGYGVYRFWKKGRAQADEQVEPTTLGKA